MKKIFYLLITIVLITFSGITFGQVAYAVLQVPGGTLSFCNNIIIHNAGLENVNVSGLSADNVIANTLNLFVHNNYDFMPKDSSVAVDAGSNDCNGLERDILNKFRVRGLSVDAGAIETDYRAMDSARYAVLQVPGGTLSFCNNIIIHNAGLENVNVSGLSADNVIANTLNLFVHNNYDFMPKDSSVAVDAGSNDCNGLERDILNKFRVRGLSVDAGAIETDYRAMDSARYAVLQVPGGTLTFCNNIIIHNAGLENVNVSGLSADNVIANTLNLFVHNNYDFMPKDSSVAVDAGSNDCNGLAKDAAGWERVVNEVIDIGAYETHYDLEQDRYAVLNEEGGTLVLHNNIVIHNIGAFGNANILNASAENMLTDESNVFVNNASNFELALHSAAIDAGNNVYCTNIAVDMKQLQRIACGNTVDLGAYEFQLSTPEASITAFTSYTSDCSGTVTTLVASGGNSYQWAHTSVTSDTVQVTPVVPTTYYVTVSNGGTCWDTASIVIDPLQEITSSIYGTPSTSGTRFWLSFMKNYANPASLSILISAKVACTGTISNTITGWQTAFAVPSNGVTRVVIPNDQVYCSQSEVITNNGILVQSTEAVSLYASNFEDYTYDVTDVLPVEALSNDYIVQTYTPLIASEFLIVAAEDGTTVDITPTARTASGHSANVPFSVTLNRGQTYLVLSYYGGTNGDLSGTTVKSQDPSKVFALFNGNVCANVPVGNHWCDHVVEQAFSTQHWGKKFAVTASAGLPFDVVRITASKDNTVIKKNGIYLATIQHSETYEFQLSATERSCYVETSFPSAVYLYIIGAEASSSTTYNGDPSMVWIPPVEQKIDEITFSTFQTSQITNHYVNIVAMTSDVQTVTLDGTSIASQFHTLTGDNSFSYARVNISNGSHTLKSNLGFIAHVYGTGHCESYAYIAGSRAMPLVETMLVDGDFSNNLTAEDVFCSYQDIDFSANINYPYDSIVWNFGDGTPELQGDNIVHHFEEEGTYIVSMTVFNSNGGETNCMVVNAQLTVRSGYNTYDSLTVCQGQSVQFHDLTISTDSAGCFTHIQSVPIANSECDSNYVLNLTVLRSVYPFAASICLGETYNDHGFVLSPQNVGIYSYSHSSVNSVTGCDSIVTLQLEVTPSMSEVSGIIGLPNVCKGNTYTYSIDSLSGLTDFVWSVPVGAYIQHGQNTSAINVRFYDDAASGFISVHCQNACGDTTFRMMVTPRDFYYLQYADTLCEGENYLGYGFDLDSLTLGPNVFVRELVSSYCCDSTIVLSLFINKRDTVTKEVSLCQRDLPLLFCDSSITEQGQYVFHLHNRNNCDSTVYLNFTIRPSFDTTFNASIYYGETYTENGFNENMPGTYTHDFDRVNGCDSVLTLNLTVLLRDTVEIYKTVCDSFSWNDSVYSVSGDYTRNLAAANGCDSIVTLHLTINHSIHVTIHDTICQGTLYNLYGFNIPIDSTQIAGTRIETMYGNVVLTGCDSITVLLLTIRPLPEVAVSFSDTAICLGDSVTLTAAAILFQVAIGDILCTDSSIVKPEAYAGSGKTAMGIVFYVDSTGLHGWATALHDACTDCRWGPYSDLNSYTSSDDIPALLNYTTARTAITDMGGMSNTIAIKNHYGSNFSGCQAAYNVYYYNHLTNNADTVNRGWYLPAAGQLRYLYTQFFPVNTSLAITGGTQLANNEFWLYWSSSESSYRNSWSVDYSGLVGNNYKGHNPNHSKARGIRDF